MELKIDYAHAVLEFAGRFGSACILLLRQRPDFSKESLSFVFLGTVHRLHCPSSDPWAIAHLASHPGLIFSVVTVTDWPAFLGAWQL